MLLLLLPPLNSDRKEIAHVCIFRTYVCGFLFMLFINISRLKFAAYEIPCTRNSRELSVCSFVDFEGEDETPVDESTAKKLECSFSSNTRKGKSFIVLDLRCAEIGKRDNNDDVRVF